MSKNKNNLWSFFSSIKLTIVLLVLVVFLFSIASFFPQADPYHAPLFYILMSLLSLNLIICSLNRFPLSLKQFKAATISEPAGIFNSVPQNQTIITDQDRSAAESAIESSIRKQCSTVRKMDTKKGILFLGERRRFSIFGVYIVHLSILIMIAGALAGSIFGLEADLNIKEGESVNIMNLKGDKGTKALDFNVRCDKFILELYDNGMPKTYRSDLSFIRNGQVEKQGSLFVNHPISFGGLRFYQSSYGAAPDAKAVLMYNKANQKSAELAMAAGDSFFLPGHDRVDVLRVEENVMKMGPAVKLKITSGQKEVQFWVFRYIDEIAAANPGLLMEIPLFNPGLFKPYVFSLTRLEQPYFTGLHIVRDPSLPFVAAGAALLIVGLLTIFLLPYQRFWVRMEQAETKILISIAGGSSRNQATFDSRLARLITKIQENLSR